MRIKVISIIACLALCCAGLKAQDVPQTVTVKVEDFEYKKPSAGKMALNVLAVAADTKTLFMPDKSMVPQINEAIVAGASNIPWVDRLGDGNVLTDYRLKGTITNSETGTGNMPGVSIKFHASLIDEKTGKTVGTKQMTAYANTPTGFDNLASLKSYAYKMVSRETAAFILEALPITGVILEKGVEQANGKIKDNQCYVNLGTLHGVFEEMKLYIVDDGKYKGELKVKEVMGDDLCSCKISSGKAYVSKCIEKGETVEVTSRPKKIQ